jgi:glyoxylase-like metal-dependent hydrolase (beta-lactamase superfamily II)
MLVSALPVWAQESQASASGDVHVLPVQGNVYMLVGPESNAVVSVGKQGVFVVDSMGPGMSSKILAAIRTLSDKPIHYIVDTTYKLDRTGSSSELRHAGTSVYGGGGANFLGTGAIIIGHANVVTRMSEDKTKAFPADAWPEEVFINDKESLNFNNEAIEIIHIPATTDTDSIVFFRGSDVIMAGDLFWTNAYPVIDTEAGGSLDALLDGLNRIVDMAVPLHLEEGGTYVIPGRGRLCDQADITQYRDMVTIIRDRIQKMINKGMTLDQVQAAKVTLDYDPQFGDGKAFVANVYNILAKKK